MKLLAVLFALASLLPAAAFEKPRTIVLTDISAPHQEPDDQQSLIRLLVYANEIDLEGLVATTSTWRRDELNPRTIEATIDAYEKVRDHLLVHSPGYPEAFALRAMLTPGQPGYGMESVGEGKSTGGSELIISRVLDHDDPRPVWIQIWGGANTLAQALFDVRAERPADLDRFVSKIRAYDIGGQDDAGAWIAHEFPKLLYLRSNLQWRSMSYRLDGKWPDGRGADESLVSPEWFTENVRENHGPLGAIYPPAKYLHEGDSPALLYVLPNGLSDPEHPDWGGWGGRFSATEKKNVAHVSDSMGDEEKQWQDYLMLTDATDTWTGRELRVGKKGQLGKPKIVTYEDSVYAPLFRWREAVQNDFAARMDWSATPDFAKANHPPVAVVNGKPGREIIRLTAKAGEAFSFDAAASTDPDGDSLKFRWYLYPEAGTYQADARFGKMEQSSLGFKIPAEAAGKTIHLILEVTDDGVPPLTAYRRMVIEVE